MIFVPIFKRTKREILLEKIRTVPPKWTQLSPMYSGHTPCWHNHKMTGPPYLHSNDKGLMCLS